MMHDEVMCITVFREKTKNKKHLKRKMILVQTLTIQKKMGNVLKFKNKNKENKRTALFISLHQSEMKRKKCTDSISHLFTHKTLGQQAKKEKKFPPSSTLKDVFFPFLTETGFFFVHW